MTECAIITPMTESGQFLDDDEAEATTSSSLRVAAWFGVAVGALAIGLYIGREILSRYKFSHRTPYDYYSHAGDDQDGFGEFGFGI